jgi:hypothetical protein
MNMPIVQKLEICFWDVVIRVLTQSNMVRSLIRFGSNVINRREITRGLLMISSGGLVGLVIGIVLPLFLQSVR